MRRRDLFDDVVVAVVVQRRRGSIHWRRGGGIYQLSISWRAALSLLRCTVAQRARFTQSSCTNRFMDMCRSGMYLIDDVAENERRPPIRGTFALSHTQLRQPCGLGESLIHALEACTVSRTDTNRAVPTDLIPRNWEFMPLDALGAHGCRLVTWEAAVKRYFEAHFRDLRPETAKQDWKLKVRLTSDRRFDGGILWYRTVQFLSWVATAALRAGM